MYVRCWWEGTCWAADECRAGAQGRPLSYYIELWHQAAWSMGTQVPSECFYESGAYKPGTAVVYDWDTTSRCFKLPEDVVVAYMATNLNSAVTTTSAHFRKLLGGLLNTGPESTLATAAVGEHAGRVPWAEQDSQFSRKVSVAPQLPPHRLDILRHWASFDAQKDSITGGMEEGWRGTRLARGNSAYAPLGPLFDWVMLTLVPTVVGGLLEPLLPPAALWQEAHTDDEVQALLDTALAREYTGLCDAPNKLSHAVFFDTAAFDAAKHGEAKYKVISPYLMACLDYLVLSASGGVAQPENFADRKAKAEARAAMARTNDERVRFWVRHWKTFQTRLFLVWRQAIELPVSQAEAESEHCDDANGANSDPHVEIEDMATAHSESQQSDSEEGHTPASPAAVAPQKRLRESRRMVDVTPGSAKQKKARTDPGTSARSSPRKATTKASRNRDRQASEAADQTPPGQTYTSEDGLDLTLTQRALLGSVPTSTLMPASDSGIFPVFPFCA